MPDPPRQRSSPVDQPGQSHPFLTQRGLWLQQNGRLDQPEPVPLPRWAPGGDFPVDPDDATAPIDDKLVRPWLRRRCEDSPADASRQNVFVSNKFPDPDRLRVQPLTRYFRTEPARGAEADVRRAVGKLVIALPGERPDVFASGSAWVTGPNTIATSAHNLFDSNKRQWAAGLQFYAGYDFYSRVAGPVCRVTSARLPRRYLDNPLTNHDLAVCRVDRNIGDLIDAEIPLREIPGIDFFENHPVVITGYPAGSGFDFGKQLWESHGSFLFGLSGGGDDDPSPALATNFGGGASGCPWLAIDSATGRWTSVGITSGHARLRYDSGEPNLMALTSPLINARTLAFLDDDAVEHSFV